MPKGLRVIPLKDGGNFGNREMQTIQDILQKKQLAPVEKPKNNITQEFQSFGLFIADQLNDNAHKGVYIRMAKTYPRSILTSALSFVSDSGARNKGALFMWKCKQLRSNK